MTDKEAFLKETFPERLARLETLRDLKVGDKVRVIQTGKTGTLVRRRTPKRDGWDVQWDEPVFGVTKGRVQTAMLERL
jgi:dsDNA-specific endonuclease/ATPase MutS2